MKIYLKINCKNEQINEIKFRIKEKIVKGM